MDLRSFHVHLNVFMMFYGSCVDESFLFPFIEDPLLKTGDDVLHHRRLVNGFETIDNRLILKLQKFVDQ